jgi:hypothetical protein
MMVCIFFIFAAMLEYGIIVVFNRMRPNLHEVKIFTQVHPKPEESTKMDVNQFEKKVDKFSLVLSIVLFALYNIGYWIYYW